MNETAKLEIKQLGPHDSAERADRDARLISVLGHTALYEAYYSQDDSYNAARYITETYAPGRLAAELLDPAITYFVIYQDEKAVGFAKFRSGGTHESVTSRNAVELQRIYIIEHVYATGVGEHLLKFCLDHARSKGFDTLWLGVWEENLRARRFYEKHGFRRVGTVTFPYADAVGTNHVMQIDLAKKAAV